MPAAVFSATKQREDCTHLTVEGYSCRLGRLCPTSRLAELRMKPGPAPGARQGPALTVFQARSRHTSKHFVCPNFFPWHNRPMWEGLLSSPSA